MGNSLVDASVLSDGKTPASLHEVRRYYLPMARSAGLSRPQVANIVLRGEGKISRKMKKDLKSIFRTREAAEKYRLWCRMAYEGKGWADFMTGNPRYFGKLFVDRRQIMVRNRPKVG